MCPSCSVSILQDMNEWASWLSTALPPDPSKTYISGQKAWDSSGLDVCRPYHLPISPDAGNKGHVAKEPFRNLMILILTKGFQSDALQAGTELLLACKPDKRLFNEAGLKNKTFVFLEAIKLYH